MAWSFSVPPDCHGERLDAVVARLAQGLSKRAARRAIDAGAVYVDGTRIRVQSRILQKGQLIRVEDAAPAPETPLPFVLLHMDDDVAVVNKPAGMPTEPTPAGAAGTAKEALRLHLRGAGAQVTVLAAAHRLDVDTSGVVVFARTAKAAAHLAAQFKDATVVRGYIALVTGALVTDGKPQVIDAPLERHLDMEGRILVSPHGLAARTDVTAVAAGRGATLCRVHPHTGRTHQIRVHLAHVDHALVGDRRYGKPAAGIEHLGLHANALTLTHPSTGQRVTYVAPPPDGFTAAAAQFDIDAAAIARACEPVDA